MHTHTHTHININVYEERGRGRVDFLHVFDMLPSTGDLHSLIGLSLVLGFVFMLLIDQCSTKRSGGKERSMTATLGLVVHSAADGVALGAAATTSQADVEAIVFLAIMLHKVSVDRFARYPGIFQPVITNSRIFFLLSACS
jgi:zinc transporter 9